LEKIRWKDRIYYPHCKSNNIVKNETNISLGVKTRRYVYKDCKHTFDVKTETIFKNMKVPIAKMVYNDGSSWH